MSSDHRLRRRRRELELTQTELAREAKVSRQLVVAVEAGVNTPAVDAALRLAQALGCSVEDMFEHAPTRRQRSRGVASRLGEIRAGPLVVAGCDPALALAESMLAGQGSELLVAIEATSGSALRSLCEGNIHAAVVHGCTGKLPQPPIGVVRLQLAHWQVGLGMPQSVDARSLAQCLELAVPIVQRQENAASQQALRRAATALGQALPAGLVTSAHADAARAAAALSCAGITTEGAAKHNGLAFAPLEVHTVELWLDRRWGAHRGFQALGELLRGAAFARKASRLGGYDLSGCGTVLAPA